MFDLEVTIDFTNGHQLQFESEGNSHYGEVTIINKADEVIISSVISKYWETSTFTENGWESYPFEVEQVRVDGISYPDVRKIAVLSTVIKHSFPHAWERIMREVYISLELDADSILSAEESEGTIAAIKAALEEKSNIEHAKHYPYRVLFLNGNTYVLGDVSKIPNNCRETDERDDYGRIIYREVSKDTDKWEKDYDTCVWLL